ncbi:MAG: alpha/beta hydrolase [Chloroflexota bacterium]
MASKVKANEIIINFEDEGVEDNVIFVHGYGDNCKMWWNQLATPAFTKYWRLWAVDIRGCGGTERPKTDYSMDTLMKDFVQFWRMGRAQVAADLEKFEEMAWVKTNPVVVGYSMGGRIALEYAIRYPRDVRALVLVSSGVGLPRPEPTAEEQKQRDEMTALLKKGDIKKWAEMMTTNAFSPGFKQKNPKVFEKYKKIKTEQKPDALLRLREGMASASTTPDLSRLTMPVLIIVGENDAHMGPEQGKKAQEAIPGSKLVVLPTGHASPIEEPEQFNSALLEFINEVKKTVPSGVDVET